MKSLRVQVDQDRVRQLGVSSKSLAEALNAVTTGMVVTQVRDSIYLTDLVARSPHDIARGLHPWDAVIDATTHRFRPIVLTAAAASLGMIPIAPEVFWGPMAYAIIGGLFVATLRTLLFLPAPYVAWFRVKEPRKEREVSLRQEVPAVAK